MILYQNQYSSEAKIIKITLLGDSIRLLGYGKKTEELLGDRFEVFQPEENCRFAKHTARGVWSEWKEQMKGSSIIHWNNGLWDVHEILDGRPFSTYEQYEQDMLTVLAGLKKITSNIIFATTTPVLSGCDFSNLRIAEYNEKIVPVLKANGVIINDLHSFVYPNVNKYIRTDDKVHLTEEGINACAQKVAEIILKTAQNIK